MQQLSHASHVVHGVPYIPPERVEIQDEEQSCQQPQDNEGRGCRPLGRLPGVCGGVRSFPLSQLVTALQQGVSGVYRTERGGVTCISM